MQIVNWHSRCHHAFLLLSWLDGLEAETNDGMTQMTSDDDREDDRNDRWWWPIGADEQENETNDLMTKAKEQV